MATIDSFDDQMLKIWLHFHCLEATNVNQLSKDNLTVFKIDNKDYIYRTAKKGSKLPMKVEIQEATTYVYNRDKQNDALGKEIQKILNAKQESRKKDKVEFDSCGNPEPNVNRPQDPEFWYIEIAMQLRMMANEVQTDYADLLTAFTSLSLESSRFVTEYERRMEEMSSVINSGWNRIAFIFTLTERLANRISNHSKSVLDAGLRSINHIRTFFESEGGWNNNHGIERIESSVDSLPTNNTG